MKNLAYCLFQVPDTVVATAAGQAHTAVPPLSARRPGLPEWVLHVVGRALASDPAARFTDATSMRSAITDRASTATLTAWASTPVGPDATMVFERPTTQSQPASNFPVGVPETLARERKRRRLIAPVIAASLLGAVVAVSWGLSRSGVDSAAGTTTPPATATAVTTTTKASTTIAPTSTVRTATALTPATVTSTTVSSTTSTPLTTAAPATSAPVTMPQTISGLIQLLEGDPGRYGEFGPELRDRLKLIDKINPRQRGGQDLFDAVDQLSVEVDEWFEDGKLDEDLTDATQDVLFSLVN